MKNISTLQKVIICLPILLALPCKSFAIPLTCKPDYERVRQGEGKPFTLLIAFSDCYLYSYVAGGARALSRKEHRPSDILFEISSDESAKGFIKHFIEMFRTAFSTNRRMMIDYPSVDTVNVL